MASISSIVPPASSTTSGATSSGSLSKNGSTPSSIAADPLANESTFLKLLVSQLKNQNPASPMEGTTFVTQLAQFSDLEQNLAMRQDLDAINSKYNGSASSSTAASSNSDGSAKHGTVSSSGATGSKS